MPFPALIVAGETSGEEHAAGLVREIRSCYPHWSLRWFGSGGRHMAAQGVELLVDVGSLAAIGPWEAFFHMADYWRLYRRLLREARRRRPRLAVLVDFPEFNLRLAARLKALQIPVCYFISPQIWAWRSSRLKLIRRYVDLMLVIFPFEEDFYRRQGVNAHYVGNPTATRLQSAARRGAASDSSTFRVALLPGSRATEVERIFPVQLDAARFIARRHPTRFWAIKAPSLEVEQLERIYQWWRRKGNPVLDLEIRQEEAVQLLPRADCAIIKSGTSTLEAMILEVPFAMVYQISPASWYLARPLVRTRTYCLANLIAGKKIVPEFVQEEATGEKIGSYIVRLLENGSEWESVKEELRTASKRLDQRDAYLESARLIGQLLAAQ